MIIEIFNHPPDLTHGRHLVFIIGDYGSHQARKYNQLIGGRWPELAEPKHVALGSAISKQVGDVTFHAVSCHHGENWIGSATHLQDGLDFINVLREEEVALYVTAEDLKYVGLGLLAGAARCKKRVAVYYE